MFQLVNCRYPVPPPSRRRRVLVRVGERLRFATGLQMDVQADPAVGGHELRMVWSHRDATLVALTAYEPVTLGRQRIVLRAIATVAGRPVAVVAEVEQLGLCRPAVIEVAS